MLMDLDESVKFYLQMRKCAMRREIGLKSVGKR